MKMPARMDSGWTHQGLASKWGRRSRAGALRCKQGVLNGHAEAREILCCVEPLCRKIPRLRCIDNGILILAWILRLCPCGSAVGQSRFRRSESTALSPKIADAPTCFDADSLRFVLPFSGKQNAPKSYKKALISKKSRLFWWGRVDLPLRGINFESKSKHQHPPKGGC